MFRYFWTFCHKVKQLKSIKPPFRVNIYVSFLEWSHDGYLFFRLIFFYGTFKFLIQSWPGLGIRSSVIWANRSVFAKKWANERFARKNKRFTHSLIFGEQPERFAHGCSFLVRDLSNLLTSLIFGEQPERFAHIAQGKWAIVSESLTSLTKKEEMSENERFAHFFEFFFKP